MYCCNLFGKPVYSIEAMAKYKQKRTHKKRRINKKWLKKYGKTEMFSSEIFYMDSGIFGSPSAIKTLMEIVNGR
jgi:hypothetical protein